MPQISEPKKLSQSRTQFTVTFTMEETLAAEGKTIARVGQSVRIDGFRPGKAPAEEVRKRVPAEALLEETVRDVLPGVFQTLFGSNKVSPVIPPKVDVQQKAPLTIVVIATERPEVKVKGAEKIKIAKKEPSFDEKDVTRMLDYLQSQYRTFTPADRAAKSGDQVTLDFVGTDKEGKEVGGTRATDYQVVLGSESLIPGFEKNLEGLAKGDQKSFTLTFPKDYHAEQLRDKPVTFAVTIKAIAEVHTPAMTDAFVKEHSLGESLEDLKKKIRESMRAQEEQSDRQRRENELFDAILKATTIDLGDEILSHEERQMFAEIERQLTESNQSFEEWMKRTKRTPESLQKELRDEAKKRLTLRFAIEQLLKDKQIEVSDDEVQKSLTEIQASMPEKRPAPAKGSEEFEELRWRKRVEKLVETMLAA